jgi:hypothetical protein
LSSLVICACGRIGFDPGSTGDAARPSVDAAVALATCPADPRLVACYALDGSAQDLSGHGNDAVVSAVTYVPGIDGLAIETTASSRGDLTMPALDLSRFTIEGWIRPELDSSSLQIVFDHNMRWALVIEPGLVIGCDLQGDTVLGNALALGVWVHVACIHDGTTMTVYRDVGVVGSRAVGPVAPGTFDAAIGGNAPPTDAPAPYVGAIDRLRIWNVALSAAELCAAAGTC